MVEIGAVAWYRCLGCGKPLHITLNTTVEDADEQLKKVLGGKCPHCGRKLNEHSRKLTETEESEFRYRWQS